MQEEYKTILSEGSAEIIEKKSRFIANLRPVKTEEEARAFIEEMRKKYWDAKHHVFAYQLGERNECRRYSDDGEPSGTAGMPVLQVLTGEEIQNAIIVVTRYFGGTLLGTGGLVRAYGRAAKEGLLATGIVSVARYLCLQIVSDYADAGKIQYILREENHAVQDTMYTEEVTQLVLVQPRSVEGLQTKITDVTKARARVTVLGSVAAAKQGEALQLLEPLPKG